MGRSLSNIGHEVSTFIHSDMCSLVYLYVYCACNSSTHLRQHFLSHRRQVRIFKVNQS